MPWAVAGAVIGAGIAADAQGDAAKKSADASNKATAATVGEQRRQFDLTRQDQADFLMAGRDALNRQQRALDGDWSGFQSAPDYLYARREMEAGLDRGAAARGRLYSGGYGVDMARNLDGLASQNFNNYWSRLAGRAGQGQASAQNLAGYGAQMANNIGNAYMQNANARSSAYQQQANAWSNFGQTVGQGIAYYGGQRGNSGGNSWGWGGV